MPSASKPQATLMAMAAHNPAFAKKKGIPGRVAKDFNRADKRSGILKKGGGGPASMMGHALSGTQLGGTDNLIRKAQDRFTMFADGGAVKKPPGPSAKERHEIRSMIERGKTDAVGALRGMRSALIHSQEDAPVEEPDADTSLARLRSQLAIKSQPQPDHALLHDEYRELLQHVDNPKIDPELRGQMQSRMSSIEDMLGGAS